MSISSSAVLVELNISAWPGKKLDKEVTDKTTADNGAAANAAQVHKNLMAGTTLRKEISDFAAGCRLWHNTRTLPWSDKGPRLLPTAMFLDYKTEINTRRDTFNGMKRRFLIEYPALIQVARNFGEGLGAMFKEEDYPSPEAMEENFGFKLVFTPLPEAGDFRLDIPEQDRRELASEYEHAFDNRLADAMKKPWEQLHTLLTAMSAKLHDKEGTEEKKRYHDTLITNATDLCSLLTHLNLTKDEKLEEARRDLEKAIKGLTIEDIKDSAMVRAETKAKLDAILKAREW
jgi:hypothetical protein